MTDEASPDKAPADEEAIVRFLVEHPDFFRRYPMLLETLDLPHDSGGAASLLERQIAVLRDRNKELRSHLAELRETAAGNEATFDKMRALTLVLMDARDTAAFNKAMRDDLVGGFGADDAVCFVFGAPLGAKHPHLVFVKADEPDPLEISLADDPVCQACRPDAYRRIFGRADLQEPGSLALVPMRSQRLDAVLAIGSRDPARFGGDMGTLFLAYLGEVVGRTLLRIHIAGQVAGQAADGASKP